MHAQVRKVEVMMWQVSRGGGREEETGGREEMEGRGGATAEGGGESVRGE